MAALAVGPCMVISCCFAEQVHYAFHSAPILNSRCLKRWAPLVIGALAGYVGMPKPMK